jgi:hypothetical protein
VAAWQWFRKKLDGRRYATHGEHHRRGTALIIALDAWMDIWVRATDGVVHRTRLS